MLYLVLLNAAVIQTILRLWKRFCWSWCWVCKINIDETIKYVPFDHLFIKSTIMFSDPEVISRCSKHMVVLQLCELFLTDSTHFKSTELYWVILLLCAAFLLGQVTFVFFPTWWLREHCTISPSPLPSIPLCSGYYGHLPEGSLRRDRNFSGCGSICHEALNFTEEPLKVTWALDRQTVQDGLSWLFLTCSRWCWLFPSILKFGLWFGNYRAEF